MAEIIVDLRFLGDIFKSPWPDGASTFVGDEIERRDTIKCFEMSQRQNRKWLKGGNK